MRLNLYVLIPSGVRETENDANPCVMRTTRNGDEYCMGFENTQRPSPLFLHLAPEGPGAVRKFKEQHGTAMSRIVISLHTPRIVVSLHTPFQFLIVTLHHMPCLRHKQSQHFELSNSCDEVLWHWHKPKPRIGCVLS